MNDKELENIIDEIFREAKQGLVVFDTPASERGEEDPWVAKSRFLTKVEGVYNQKSSRFPTLNVQNKELFIKAIKKYLKVATQFYAFEKEDEDLSDRGFIKRLIFDLIINCSVDDFNNIYKHIDCKTKMLSQEMHTSLVLGVYEAGKMPKSLFSARITQNHSCMEQPFRFEVEIMDENKNKFYLPAVLFGISDGVAHVGAVQNFHTKQDSELAKRADRYFRKVGEGVDPESTEAQVSPNAVVALALFFEYLKQIGIKKVVAANYLPLRYETKLKSETDLEVKKFQKQERENLKEEKKSKISPRDIAEEKTNRIQFNITNKFTYLFSRLAFHFDNLLFDYDDSTSKVYMKISDKDFSRNGNIIEDLVKMVQESNIQMQ